MANGKTHMALGALIGTSNYIIQNKTNNQEITFGEIFLTAIASAGVGLIADIIDPPTSPNHRSIGHSLLLNSIILPKIWNFIEDNNNLNFKQKKFYQSLIAAHGSHLALDSTTPRRLPLII